MLGGLPYLTPLAGHQPAQRAQRHPLQARHRRRPATIEHARRLPLPARPDRVGRAATRPHGSAIVQVTRLDGPTNGPGGGPACSSAPVAPGQYVNPFAHTRNLTPQRIDMGVDYDGQGEIAAIGDAHITFAGTGIGGGWTCSTPTNGAIVYHLDDGPDQGQMGLPRRGRHPNRQGRRHRARRPANRDLRPTRRDRMHRDRLGLRPRLPLTDRAPGRRLPRRQRLRRLAHRRRQRHERPNPLTRRPLRHLPQPTNRRPLPVSRARLTLPPIGVPGRLRCRPRRTKPGTPAFAAGALR